MTADKRLIVIGGGIAGVSAAQAARHEYPQAEILLYSMDEHPFYNKISLGAVIAGKMPEKQLRVFAASFLEKQRILAHWGTSVTSIAVEDHQVRLSGGAAVQYDRLILATGAVPVSPPIPGLESESVLRLWNLADAVRIRGHLSQCNTVAVIGGGVLGVEIAVELATLDKRVILIEAESTVLPKHLGSQAASLYQQFLESLGIRLELQTRVAEIQSRAGAMPATCLAVTGSAGIDCDLVLLLAGVVPDLSLARAAGLDTDWGILVDPHLRTSDPDVLACGNCIQWGGRQSALWNSAKSQGEIAGLNGFENKKPWNPFEPAIHLKTPQMPLFICGEQSDVTSEDRVIEFRSGETYRAICLDDQRRIKYAIFLCDTRGAHLIERAFRRAIPLPEEPRRKGSIDAIIDNLHQETAGRSHQMSGWTCQMCGYVHEGDNPPEICPVCSVGKDQFMAA